MTVIVGINTQVLAGGEGGLAVNEGTLDVGVRVIVIEIAHVDVLAIDGDAHDGFFGLGEVGGVRQVGHGVALYIQVLRQGRDFIGLGSIDDVLICHVEPVGCGVTQADELVAQLGENTVFPSELDFALFLNDGHALILVIVHAVGVVGIANVNDVKLRQFHDILAIACWLGLDPGQDGEPDVAL